ncbi:MAG: metallophosphoesterase [Burkholderiales bacterium]|nr:metallophosphoesterase [Burkholderiales bacterium]
MAKKKRATLHMHRLNKNNLGKHLFRFVVIADTHCNQEENRSASPFAVNALANTRARHVISEINQLSPSFVIHLGDLVHPVPELPSFLPAVEQFKLLTRELNVNLHLIPGNHDVGDKPVAWMPAGTVTTEFVNQYRELFGDDFYSFDTNGCHIVMINAQIINSGLPREEEQRSWLEEDFKRHAGGRIFIGIHYPPYVTDRHEASSYDNIDEPGRSWLLALIEQYRPEAIFCGHVHNFWYDVIGSTEMYLLPSTAFVRHDYSELYRVGPGKEQGRNEAEKLGYFVVEVHERGHVAHFVRTYGNEQKSGAPYSKKNVLSPVHTKTNFVAPVGVDLRHPWQEIMEVAATGGVQEFERKKVRNDYPLMAMWELGIRKLRVPLHDLMDQNLRDRMRLLTTVGHRFTVHHFGLPSSQERSALIEFRDVVDTLEIVAPMTEFPVLLNPLADLRRLGQFPIFLSKLRKHEDAQYDGSHFNHFINHGFVIAERKQVSELFERPEAHAAADGVVIRVIRQRTAWEAVQDAVAFATDLGIRATVQIRLAADNPAEVLQNDLDIANRVAETVLTGFAYPDTDIILDTFEDIDRGYFSRNGLVDRRCNLRAAGFVYKNMHAALSELPRPTLTERKVLEDGALCSFSTAGKRGTLALPRSDKSDMSSLLDAKGYWIDLITGQRGSAADVIHGHPFLCLQQG